MGYKEERNNLKKLRKSIPSSGYVARKGVGIV